MKFKTTTKYIKENNNTILSVGYCKMSSLLKYQEKTAYTAGIYGWNYDIYEVNNVAICTGYRGMPENKNIKDDYDLIKQYEEKAQKIQNNYKLTYEQQEEQTNNLLYKAVDYQILASDSNFSYAEIAFKTDYFTKLGKQYGLLTEFKENGVI